MKEFIKKHIKKIGLATILIICAVVAGILIYNNLSYAGNIESNECKVEYNSENKIEIINANQLSEEEGLKILPLNYKIENSCSTNRTYKIILEVNAITNINVDNLKIGYNNEIINFSDLTVIPSERGLVQYELKTNINIDASTSSNIDLRIWESDANQSVNNVEKTISVNFLLEDTTV